MILFCMYKYKINLGIIIAPCFSKVKRQSKDWRFFCFKSTERNNIMENKINIKKVAALNDNLRKTFTGGCVLLTIGFRSLPEDEQAEVLQKVRAFNDFTQDNDPYQEHDFGQVISSRGTQVFWKIDLYDINDEFYSPQPDDPTQTNRVMTILLADEY